MRAGGGDGAPAEPADRLGRAVLDADEHSGAQPFDGHLALRRGDQGAAHEAGHLFDGDHGGVGMAGLVQDGIVEIDLLAVAVAGDGEGAVGVQRHLLAGAEGDGVARRDRSAVDMGDRERAAGRMVVVEHVEHLGVVVTHGEEVVLGHDGGLDRAAGDQQVGVVFRIAHIGDANLDGVDLAGVDRGDEGEGDGEAVHLGVELVLGVVVIEVRGHAAVDVADRGRAVADGHMGLHAVDPDADHVVEIGADIFGVFLGAEDEVDGQQVADGGELDLEKGGVIGLGAGDGVKVSVVVDTLGIGGGGGGEVGVGRSAGIGEVGDLAGGQDHAGVAGGGVGRDGVAVAVDARGAIVAGVGGRGDSDPLAEDLVRHLKRRGAGVDRKFGGCGHGSGPGLCGSHTRDHVKAEAIRSNQGKF